MKKQDIIVELDGEYPRKLCVSIWREKINESQLIVGKTLIMAINIESNKFSGKWSKDLKLWKVDATGQGAV